MPTGRNTPTRTQTLNLVQRESLEGQHVCPFIFCSISKMALTLKITTELLLMMDRKSYIIFFWQEVIYEVSFGTIVFDLEWPGEVKSRSHRISMGYISKSIHDNHSYYWWWIGTHIWGFIWHHCLYPWVTFKGQFRSHRFSMPISPNLFKIKEIIYEVSFGAIVFDLEWPWKVNPGHTGFQWPISPSPFKITTELLLMMDRKSYMRFHLAPLSLT